MKTIGPFLMALGLCLALSFALLITGCTPIGSYEYPTVSSYQEAARWIKQNITYTSDLDAEGVLDSWKHPALTIQDKYGDCEDMALLFLAIIRQNFSIEGELVVQGIHPECHAWASIPGYEFSRQDLKELFRLSYRTAIARTRR